MSDRPDWMDAVETALREWADDLPITDATTVRLYAAGPPIEYRETWGALPPKSNPGGFESFEATVCHYTAANKGYPRSNHADCQAQVRSIQQQHQGIPEQSDIEYNALVCNHGTVFEGRVLGYKGGANGTAESNRTMPSICALLGVDDKPSDALLSGVAWFHSRVEERAHRSLVMLKHMDIVSTSCPGVPMSEWVDAGGYHSAPTPEPQPPQEDDMPAPDVVQINSEWDGLVVGSVCICDPFHQTYRHVADEDELNQLRMTFDRRGWRFPDPIPAIPGWWLKQYGHRL